jgi:hypothetical protein
MDVIKGPTWLIGVEKNRAPSVGPALMLINKGYRPGSLTAEMNTIHKPLGHLR